MNTKEKPYVFIMIKTLYSITNIGRHTVCHNCLNRVAFDPSSFHTWDTFPHTENCINIKKIMEKKFKTNESYLFDKEEA